MFRNHGSESCPQLRLKTVWNYPQIPILQSATIVAGLFHASGRLVHNFSLEYFHLNPSPVVATYMFRNHCSGTRLQLWLNTAWNYPQILISQLATISARGSSISLPSSQSVTITADSNCINSLSLTANRRLRSSMTSSTRYKNSRVPSHISYCQFALSTHRIVHLSHCSLITSSAYLFFCLPPSLHIQ